MTDDGVRPPVPEKNTTLGEAQNHDAAEPATAEPHGTAAAGAHHHDAAVEYYLCCAACGPLFDADPEKCAAAAT